jgi:protein tyrosine phosphatase (PTP) superfamily phosphohydrolase (DUF442 family)
MRRYGIFAAWFLCSTIALGGCSARRYVSPRIAQISTAEKMTVPGVPDFGKVNNFLYRGAQPRDDGVEQLKKLGIDTIIDLRAEFHGLIESERERAEALGMRFINLPGNGWSDPTDAEIARFFSLMQERPRRKVFIHCWLGGDRSGTFIAAYRIAFDGWTPERAVEEMREFHYLEFWHPGMKKYVETFPERLAHSPELAPFRNIARKSAAIQNNLAKAPRLGSADLRP